MQRPYSVGNGFWFFERENLVYCCRASYVGILFEFKLLSLNHKMFAKDLCTCEICEHKISLLKQWNNLPFLLVAWLNLINFNCSC